MSQAADAPSFLCECRPERAACTRLAERTGRAESLRSARADFVNFSCRRADTSELCKRRTNPTTDVAFLIWRATDGPERMGKLGMCHVAHWANSRGLQSAARSAMIEGSSSCIEHPHDYRRTVYAA